MKSIDEKEMTEVVGGRWNPGILPSVTLGGGQDGDEDESDGTVGDDQGGNSFPE